MSELAEDRTHHYFVSYTCLLKEEWGGTREYSCAEIRRCCPIRSIEDLVEIAEFLGGAQDVEPDTLVVLFYRLLRVER